MTLPDAIKDDLAALRIEASGIRWTPREQMHLTLRYIGGADSEIIQRLAKGLGRIAVEPFLLTPEGVGRFPPRGNPRVFWGGVGSGHPRLFQLQGKVEEAVIAAGLEPETRRFHPHITLARIKPAASGSINDFLKRHRNYIGGPFRVDAFSLWVSYLQADGPVHHRAAEYQLEKP